MRTPSDSAQRTLRLVSSSKSPCRKCDREEISGAGFTASANVAARNSRTLGADAQPIAGLAGAYDYVYSRRVFDDDPFVGERAVTGGHLA